LINTNSAAVLAIISPVTFAATVHQCRLADTIFYCLMRHVCKWLAYSYCMKWNSQELDSCPLGFRFSIISVTASCWWVFTSVVSGQLCV